MKYVVLEKAKIKIKVPIRLHSGKMTMGYRYKGKMVYHGTMIEFAKRIMSDGLQPGGFFKTVFGTTDFYSAATYALNQGDYWKDGTKGAIVVVDEKAFSKEDSGIFTSKQKIPPQKIVRVEIYDPIELAKYEKKYRRMVLEGGNSEDSIIQPKPYKIIKNKNWLSKSFRDNVNYVFVLLN